MPDAFVQAVETMAAKTAPPRPDEPEPLDGHEYVRAAEQAILAYRIDGTVSGTLAGRLVATVEATRRLVDELRDESGLTDLIRHDWDDGRG